MLGRACHGDPSWPCVLTAALSATRLNPKRYQRLEREGPVNKFVSLSAMLLAAAAALSAADNGPLAGNWKLYSNIQGHESDLACTFTQTNDQIAGTCNSERGVLAVTGK